MKKIELYEQDGMPRDGMSLVYTGTRLMEEIISMGYSAYIVGGCVRDMLMGKHPHDVDIATNIPIDIIKQHYTTIEYGGGERHGTVIVRFEKLDFELTQFRSENTYSDNRRPDEVKFVNSFEEDTLRRDLTINAMGMDSNGDIIDYHGGLEDIENKIIRTVGSAEERFGEDSLRILRAARFAARLRFDIAGDTMDAMSKLGHTIKNVSDERIRDEFEKSMEGGGLNFGIFIRYLNTLDIINKIFPQFKSSSIASICRVSTGKKIVNFALMFQGSINNEGLEQLKLSSETLKAIKYCIKSERIMSEIADGDNHEQKVKIVNDSNFSYLMEYYKAIYSRSINRNYINHYVTMINAYGLDKEVNAYIKSLGMDGAKFGQTRCSYSTWVFSYYHEYLTLPLAIEWQHAIHEFAGESYSEKTWREVNEKHN